MGTASEDRDQPCAVRLPASPYERSAIEAFVTANGLTHVTYFAAKDDDELNDAVMDGRFRRVVFLDASDVMDALFVGHARIDQWLSDGVRIDRASTGSVQLMDWTRYLKATALSFARHRRRQRRRQVAAGAMLSVAALVAIAILLGTR